MHVTLSPPGSRCAQQAQEGTCWGWGASQLFHLSHGHLQPSSGLFLPHPMAQHGTAAFLFCSSLLGLLSSVIIYMLKNN